MSVSADGEKRWTLEQKQAIDVRGRDILVSAAAGSGKTSVLVERVIRRILDPGNPVDIDRVLVVTFTESAAAEMRERMRVRLTTEAQGGEFRRRAAAQLALVGKAAISTLHGFCLQILRRHFYALGLDPRFSVMGEEEARLLKLEMQDRVFEAAHEGDDGGLLAHYGGARDDRTLREIVLHLYEYVQSLPDGARWLERATASFETGSNAQEDFVRAWQSSVLAAAHAAIDRALAAVVSAKRLATLGDGPGTYLPSFEVAGIGLVDVQDALGRGEWDLAVRRLRSVEWPRLKSPKDADASIQAEARALWDEAKRVVRHWSDGALSRSLAEYVGELGALHHIAVGVAQLVHAFQSEYARAKRRYGVVDFTDLERFALDALEIEDGRLGEEYRRRFDEVLVDEYQDINPVQDRLLALLSRSGTGVTGNRFLVGDVKQSIYRFRLADPSIFQEKYSVFASPEVETAERIDLQANFRSDPRILAGVNFLFRQVMHDGSGRINYGADAFLRAGRAVAEDQGDEPRIELHLIEREDDGGDADALTGVEREASLTARLIGELVADGAFAFGDIAILMRSPKGRAGIFVEHLERAGIPAHTQAGTGFFRAVEVDVVMSLLRVLDNVQQDIPLAAVLRSPIVGMSSRDLADIRIHHPDGAFHEAVAAAGACDSALGARIREVLAHIDRWRTAARRLPLSTLLRRIYDETGYVAFVAALSGGAQREANLWGLLQRAQQFDQFRTEGLDRFVRFVDDLTDAGEELAPPPRLGEGEDVVHVMSVHQSKGLEFPIVFVVDLNRRFNQTDARRSLIFHRELGLGAAVIDRIRHVRYPSLAHRAVALQLNQDTLEEEMRLLYVAATRAKERMVWIGAVKDVDASCARWSMSTRVEGWRLPAGDVSGAGSWLDWIGRTLVRHRDGLPLRRAGAGDLGADYYEPVDPTVYADAARFSIKVWSGRDIDASREAPTADASAPLPIQRMAAGESLDVAIPEDVRAELGQRFAWIYPHPAIQTPAKVSVTEFARLLEAGEEDAEELQRERNLRPLFSRPHFSQGGTAGSAVTATERGTATHRVLARLDPATSQTLADLERQVRALVDAELLTSAEALSIDLDAIVRFLGTPLGAQVRAASGEAIQRELPFTMLVDAALFVGGSSEGVRYQPSRAVRRPTEAGTGVVVQGTIDCLIHEETRSIVIDYKTDRVAAGAEGELADRYLPQLMLYGEFVRRTRPGVGIAGFLVFLHTGRIVEVPMHTEDGQEV